METVLCFSFQILSSRERGWGEGAVVPVGGGSRPQETPIMFKDWLSSLLYKANSKDSLSDTRSTACWAWQHLLRLNRYLAVAERMHTGEVL